MLGGARGSRWSRRLCRRRAAARAAAPFARADDALAGSRRVESRRPRATVDAMGSGSCVSSRSLVAARGALGCCQPLYGGKPEKLRNPRRRSGRPRRRWPRSRSSTSRTATRLPRRSREGACPQTGDVEQLDRRRRHRARRPTRPRIRRRRPSSSRSSIDKFRNALRRTRTTPRPRSSSPLAYDRVYRKGCALEMLTRLPLARGEPEVRAGAKPRADRSRDNEPDGSRAIARTPIAAVGR